MRTYRIRWGALTTASALFALLPVLACDTRADKAAVARKSPTATTPDAALRDVPLGHVTSRDPRGVARFVMGSLDATRVPLGLSSEAAARLHLQRHASMLDLSDVVVRGAVLQASHDLPGGASIVQLTQSVGGVPVFRARASIVLDAGKHLASIATTLHPAAVGSKVPTFKRAADVAVANAYVARFGRPATTLGAPRVIESTTKQVLFPIGSRLVPAHHVEILTRPIDTGDNEMWGYVIADDDGRTLHAESLTAHDAFNYRVWADPTGNHIPMDGPMADYTPHPTGVPDKSKAAFVAPILVSMEGFNKNPNNQADPWLLPTDTVTFGNNVRAYTDRDQNGNVGDGFDAADVRADLTAPLTFDRVYDVTKAPNDSVEQEKAAVTQIFYVTNWLHDYWYDSGFNEISGVAQLSNFTRGGTEGDPLRAEAQDSADHGQSNNANMSTPADGTSPRMQMYVWSGAPNRSMVTAPVVAFPDGFGAAGYGPQTFQVTGALVLAAPNTACTPITNNVAGKIAVIDRGTCAFAAKSAAAEAAGAIGVIIVNNAAGHAAPGLGGAGAVTIGTLSLSLEDGATLKTAIGAGTVTGTLKRGVENLVDGTIDNTVVAHEWGHYLHHRLVQCGSQSCGGMSEGWADFDAVMLVVKAGDDMQGTAFPMAQYATSGITADNEYFGIRRAPYSTSFAKNPFTFGHVRRVSTLPTGAPLWPAAADMSEVHNVGEIWTETLFEGYAAMLIADKAASIPFDTTKRHMADYVVAGMKAAPAEPTFMEQRDAILSSVWAMGRPSDFNALALGFAKRGMGVGAIAPPIGSTTLNEAVENFAANGKLAFVDAKLDDLARTCDGDGILDAGESGTLTLRVKNTGWLRLTNTGVHVTSTSPNILLANAGIAAVTGIDPYGVVTVTIPAGVRRGTTAYEVIPLSVELTDMEAFQPSVIASASLLINADDVAAKSADDDVESAHPVWTQMHGATTHAVWARTGDDTNHLWHGADLPTPSDESLVSPSLVVGTGAFTIKFSHRFQFEFGGNQYFDGGVLEVSADNGVTWTDVTTYVNPAYPQTLDNSAPDNVLNGRKAWGGNSAGYPAFVDVSLDLGTQLAGKTVKVRFRAGSDDGGSSTGWDIDNLKFGGITNTPFGTIVDNAVACPTPDGGTGSPDSGTPADSGSDSGGTSGDGGFVSQDSGTSTSDSGTADEVVDDVGTLGGGACAAAPVGRTPLGAGAGILAGLFALVARRRRK